MKKLNSCIKLQIPSQEANTNPPIGPILGQKGINVYYFCKTFNEKTLVFEKGLILNVLINIYNDKSFDFFIKSTPTSILIKKELNIKTCTSKPGIENIYNIKKDIIKKIANIKINDTMSNNIDSVYKSIVGTIKSMGINIID